MFTDFLIQELLPWIRAKWHVTSNPEKTIIGGKSRGGLAAAYAALKYPKAFANVLSQSGYFSWAPGDKKGEDDVEYGWIIRQYVSRPTAALRFYISIGIQERGEGLTYLLHANRHSEMFFKPKAMHWNTTNTMGAMRTSAAGHAE